MADESATKAATPPGGQDSGQKAGQDTGQAGKEGAQSSSSSSEDHIKNELNAAQERADAEEQRQQDISKKLAEDSAAQREAYNNSDAAVVAKQVEKAEALMRGPSPAPAWVDHNGEYQTPGHVVGDPTRGPSS